MKTTTRIALTAARLALTATAAANRAAAAILGENMGAATFQHDARRCDRRARAIDRFTARR